MSCIKMYNIQIGYMHNNFVSVRPFVLIVKFAKSCNETLMIDEIVLAPEKTQHYEADTHETAQPLLGHCHQQSISQKVKTNLINSPHTPMSDCVSAFSVDRTCWLDQINIKLDLL